MKYTFLALLLALIACEAPTSTEETPTESTATSEESMGFDDALAQEVGADDYGMRQYVMAFLKAGPNRSQDSLEAARLQRAHLDNITRMAEGGSLVLAGPFMDDGTVRGIYIFDVKTIEEAEKLTATDPAIQAGRLEMELRPWYGSAALMKVNELHNKVARKGI
ncbi:MAG: YciI family protein [Chitinophagales bacterium]|nr:YciI family protein [Chitinophagales bacterium]